MEVQLAKTLQQIFAENLRRERLARGWSQRKLASKARLTRTHVGSVERGEHSTTINVIEALAKALGVEPAELLRGVTSAISPCPSAQPGF